MTAVQAHHSPTTNPAMPRRPRPRRRSELPAAVLSSTGLSWFETIVYVTLVPLLSVPLVLATMGAGWVAVVALALTAVMAWLCASRRVTIGDGWIADRRLWRYRVTRAADVRAVELVPNGHGGVLRVHPHDGRPHRLRRPEFETAQARAALSTVVAVGNPQVDANVRALLDLPRGARLAVTPPPATGSPRAS